MQTFATLRTHVKLIVTNVLDHQPELSLHFLSASVQVDQQSLIIVLAVSCDSTESSIFVIVLLTKTMIQETCKMKSSKNSSDQIDHVELV